MSTGLVFPKASRRSSLSNGFFASILNLSSNGRLFSSLFFSCRSCVVGFTMSWSFFTYSGLSCRKAQLTNTNNAMVPIKRLHCQIPCFSIMVSHIAPLIPSAPLSVATGLDYLAPYPLAIINITSRQHKGPDLAKHYSFYSHGALNPQVFVLAEISSCRSSFTEILLPKHEKGARFTRAFAAEGFRKPSCCQLPMTRPPVILSATSSEGIAICWSKTPSFVTVMSHGRSCAIALQRKQSPVTPPSAPTSMQLPEDRTKHHEGDQPPNGPLGTRCHTYQRRHAMPANSETTPNAPERPADVRELRRVLAG
jgi:hypothetical protein